MQHQGQIESIDQSFLLVFVFQLTK